MSAPRPDVPSATDPESVCADARRAREAMESGLEALRVIRRELVDATRLVEVAGRDADRQGVADRKQALQDGWRTAMEAASTGAARQDATATWLRSISDTNRRTHVAMRELAAGQRRVATLEVELRSADLDAAAMRIRAETAEAACDAARRQRAAVDERSVGEDGPERVAAAGVAAGAAAGTGGALMVAGGDEAPEAEDGSSQAIPPMPRPVESPTIRRLLAGDRATHEVLAGELAEMSGQVPARYLVLLDSLVDELTAAAVDAGELVFDDDHPLWSQFSADDARLVIRGLRDLGFRLDIHEGWFGGRAPTASDLASALGFAGHDVRALRGIPSAAVLRDLPTSIHVAALDHLRRWAPDLTLDEMARALGPRAPRLGELWDEWGRVRPLLAGGAPIPA